MHFIITIIKQYFKPESSLIRNSISFAILMSIIPLIALLSIASLHLIESTEWIKELLSGFIPIHIIQEIINVGLHTRDLGFLSFIVTLGISYYTASRSFYSIIIAFSYEEVDNHPTILYTIHSLLAPLAFIILIMITISANSIIKIMIPTLPIILNSLITMVLYIILALIFFTIISYPRHHIKDIIPGTLTFSICLTILSNLFFFYINNFTNYNDIYGSLASIMIILLAIKLISSILHICHIINEMYFKITHN